MKTTKFNADQLSNLVTNATNLMADIQVAWYNAAPNNAEKTKKIRATLGEVHDELKDAAYKLLSLYNVL